MVAGDLCDHDNLQAHPTLTPPSLLKLIQCQGTDLGEDGSWFHTNHKKI